MQLALLMAIVFGAFAVEASLGFGATVIAVAAGSFLLPIATVLPAFVPVNLFLSAYIVVRHGGGIDRRLLFRRILPFMALGLPLGMALFRYGGDHRLKVAFGCFVALLAAVELVRMARPQAAERAIPVAVAAALLVAGGVIHGAFGTGGPLAVYVAGRELPDKHRFRSTMSALWLILGGLLCASYAAGGAFHRETVRLSLACGVSLVAGVVAGEWIHRRVGRRLFASLVHSLLLIAGALLAVRS